jgi:hypothetical protein
MKIIGRGYHATDLGIKADIYFITQDYQTILESIPSVPYYSGYKN